MANQIITSDLITKATALGYKNSLKFASKITQQYSDEYLNKTFTPGDTIKVRMPVRFTVSEGQAYQQQPIYEQYVPVTLAKQYHVDMGWSTAQQTTDIREVRDRYIDPATDALASKVDVYAYSECMLAVYSALGSPGTIPSTTANYLDAGVKMTNLSTPKGGRIATLNPQSMSYLARAAATLFNPSGKVSEMYADNMQASNTLGVAEWYEDQNVQSYTTGSFTASTPLVNGANQTGSSLITDGWASGATTLQVGDTFTIGGVYTVNPVSYSNTSQLQDFVVTAQCTDTTGDMTISISPSIITSGSLQTVSNSPANNAVITVRGATSATAGTLTATSTPQNLIFNKEFATLVTADLAKPVAGALVGRISSSEMNIALRLAEQWNGLNDQNMTRIDVLVGAAALQPRLAARIYS